MFGFKIGFDEPWYLLLLVLVPILWIFSLSSLRGLGPYRRLFALGFRTIVFTLMVLALAGVQLQKISDRVTVLYLLDQSESIPKLTREAMLEYVMQDVAKHRRAGDLTNASEDKAGVIVFGREATIEHPPFADEIRAVGQLESLFELRTDATNIASALKLAQASFPEDSAKRIVVVSDGNENLGDARTIARMLTDNGIGIDVVPVILDARSEIAVEKVSLPPDIRRGQPMEARVVVQNYTQPSKENPTGEVSGRLRVTRKYGNQEELLSEDTVTLKPGKNSYAYDSTIDLPAGYTYQADFTPDDPTADVMTQNNRATAYTHVRGKGRVLLIVDWENSSEFDALVRRLGELNIEVDVQPSNRLFSTLAELQGYDCVVLGNVPRASGGEGGDVTSFTDEQIDMLVRNTEQFGCGLVMVGGPNSFGAGGWSNTELEKAMPVDFQIKNAKVKAVGALVMMMHASEMAQGNYWQKVIGQEALKVLGPSDYCGCVHWDDFTGKDNWLWRDENGRGLARIGGQQKSMLGRLDRMQPGDMPQFEPSMVMAMTAFKTNKASVKHMIIISDGDPVPPSNALLSQYKKAGIKIATVAVGTHGPAGSTPLQNIATATGGKYYIATNPKALPRIFQIETRKVARPLVKEDPNGMPLAIVDTTHDVLKDIDSLPPITGYVMTTVKENPLVEVLVKNTKAESDDTSTVLATWTYGAGKTGVFTSDAGQRWAKDWPGWEQYNNFFGQLIRAHMRPVNEGGKFTIVSDVKDGKVRVVITSLNEKDEFLNFLSMSAVGTGPDMSTIQMPVRQEAPGRYVAEFDADKAGSYLLAVNTGKGNAPLLTGVTVPYSAEFREREANEALLTTLASLKPKGGDPGKVIEGELQKGNIDRLTSLVDTFRRTLPKAVSSQDVWPLFLLIAAGVFLADVFIRRVTVHFYWVKPLLVRTFNSLRGKEAETVPDERMARLRNRKEALTSHMEQRRSAARFEPQVDEDAAAPRDLRDVLSDATGGSSNVPQRPADIPSSSAAPPEQDTYTERLLAAKKKAQKDRPQ